jgi:hypothetical protein
MHRRPVRLGLAAMAPTGAGTGTGVGEQPGLQHSVGDVIGQRPGQPRRFETADRQPHRRGRPHPPRNLAGRHPGRLQSDHIAHVAVRAKSMLGLALIDALFNPQQGRQPRDLSGYAPGLVL